MDNSNAVAGALVAANGVIDKLELATGDVPASDITWLAGYQTKLASGNTRPWEDLKFLGILLHWFNRKAATDKVG